MKKVIAYIDGFNMYHAIDKNLPEYYKWIDYRKICEIFLQEGEILKKIFFFTAMPSWDEGRKIRHGNYTRILSNFCDINVISGKYKQVIKTFHYGTQPVIFPLNAIVKPKKFSYQTFEEKETDVNIAIHVLKGGFRDEYDTAYILTADSGISPVVQMCQQLFPLKKYCFVFPYKKFGRTNHQVAHSVKTLSKKRLQDSLLPEICVFPDGTSLARPYKKPISEDMS